MVIIRAYQASDSSAIRALMIELQAYEHSIDSFTRDPNTVVDAYFAQVMAWVAEKDGAIFVAADEDQVIGFVSVTIEVSDDLLTTFTQYGYISDIVLDPAYRGQRIAQELLSEAERYARSKGCEHLMLYALAENTSAIKTYHRFGFQNREILLHKRLT